jgi:hypothetical protein
MRRWEPIVPIKLSDEDIPELFTFLQWCKDRAKFINIEPSTRESLYSSDLRSNSCGTVSSNCPTQSYRPLYLFPLYSFGYSVFDILTSGL